MSFVKKGSGAAKALSTVVKRQIGHAPPVAAHTALLPPGNEPLGGRYRVWNHNLPPTKGVAVSLGYAQLELVIAINASRARLRMADGAGSSACLASAWLRGALLLRSFAHLCCVSFCDFVFLFVLYPLCLLFSFPS